MKHFILFIMASVLAIACKPISQNTPNTVSDEQRTAVDLSDVLSAYEKNGQSSELSSEEVYSQLCPFDEDDASIFGIEIYNETPFTYEFPEFKQSKHPFLSQAEDIFNCTIIANAILNNYEIGAYFYDVDASVLAESVTNIKLDCIDDSVLRNAAISYRESMADLLLKLDEEMDEDAAVDDLNKTFVRKIEEKGYKFYDDEDELLSLMRQKYDSLSNIVEETYQSYLEADEEARLGVMLNALNNCQTFDEQCSLFFKWANGEGLSDESMWIVAVGTRLMDGEHYAPFLYKVWATWRPLCQGVYFGLSSQSGFPNKFFNEYKARCYAVCLKFIENHPDDIFAMTCASVLAGMQNMNRSGEYDYGNLHLIEEL